MMAHNNDKRKEELSPKPSKNSDCKPYSSLQCKLLCQSLLCVMFDVQTDFVIRMIACTELFLWRNTTSLSTHPTSRRTETELWMAGGNKSGKIIDVSRFIKMKATTQRADIFEQLLHVQDLLETSIKRFNLYT
jgi:hypothetical protein